MADRQAVLFMAALLLPVGTCGCAARAVDPVLQRDFRARQEAMDHFASIGFIGASQTAGFGSGLSLGRLMQAGLRFPTRIVERPDTLFFRDPQRAGEDQIEFVRAQRVSAAVALDYLFWFGYGFGSMENRRQRLERGLALLERLLPAQLLVGDLPDMRGASHLFLHPDAIPSPPELAELNARLRAWAERHPQVHVVPLADVMAALRRGDPVTLGETPRTVVLQDVLLNDRLHANRAGQFLLAALCLDTLARAYPALAGHDVMCTPEAVEEALLQRQAQQEQSPAPAR